VIRVLAPMAVVVLGFALGGAGTAPLDGISFRP
jgi:hypothetical protein